MKKSISLFALAVLVSITFQSCCKRDMQPVKKPVTTTNVNANLKENQSYQFTMPATKNGQAYNIVIPAMHSSVSYINTDALGNAIYQYTPATNYAGNDYVSFSNSSSNEAQPICIICNSGCHGGGACSQHSCNHHQECGQENIININFTITAPTAPITMLNEVIKSSN